MGPFTLDVQAMLSSQRSGIFRAVGQTRYMFALILQDTCVSAVRHMLGPC